MSARNYTVYRDHRINRALDDQLRIIVDAVADLLGPRLDAILLCGGFGRGEGGVVVDSGGTRVVNDYDIIILLRGNFVLNYSRYAARLYRLAERLSTELNIKQIDFSIRHRGMFEKRTVPSVAYYEIMTGHVALSGEPLRSPISDMEIFAENLPLTEGTVYFFHRGSGLLISARYLLSETGLADRDQENFHIEIDKAVMAVGDVLLLSKGMYHYSYEERLRRVMALDLEGLGDGDRVRDLYKRAVENKLRPVENREDVKPPEEAWFEVQSLFGRFFLDYESGRLGAEIEGWDRYPDLFRGSWRASLKRYIQKIVLVPDIGMLFGRSFRRSLRFGQEHRLLPVMPLLLFSVQRSGFDREMLTRAARLLQEADEGDGLPLWTRLVNAYLLYYHPRGAAGEVARKES